MAKITQPPEGAITSVEDFNCLVPIGTDYWVVTNNPGYHVLCQETRIVRPDEYRSDLAEDKWYFAKYRRVDPLRSFLDHNIIPNTHNSYYTFSNQKDAQAYYESADGMGGLR